MPKPIYIVGAILVAYLAVGLLYANVWAWQTTCSGSVICPNTSITGGITGMSPLFAIMEGNWYTLGQQVWANLFPTAGSITTPSVSIPYPTITVSLFGYTTIQIQFNACSVFGFGCNIQFGIPWFSFTCPLLGYSTQAFCPITWNSLTSSGSTFYFPSLNTNALDPFTILNVIGGAAFILLSIFGVATGTQGGKLLQNVGFGMLLWAGITSLTTPVGAIPWTSYLNTQYYGAGAILGSIVELAFIMSVFWQTQSSE